MTENVRFENKQLLRLQMHALWKCQESKSNALDIAVQYAGSTEEKFNYANLYEKY